MKRRRNAISAIIGTAIALTIVFAIIIPLFLYMQSLQTLFMQEANRRLQYELERLNERLEVYITTCWKEGTTPQEINICAIMFNPGIISATVPVIYFESYRYGLIADNINVIVIPGERKVISISKLAFNPAVEDMVRAKLITLRGNSFISKNTLGLRNLPYTLTILVKNMTVGYKYEVKVNVVGGYGCISEEINQVCRIDGAHQLIPQTSLDRDAVVTFMVAPGNYTVSLIVYDYMNNEKISERLSPPIEILNDIVVRLDAYTEFPLREKIPLRLISTIPNNIVVMMKGEEDTINIPYAISLGNQSEPLRDIQISIKMTLLGLNPGQDFTPEIVKKISRILPGETYFDTFQVNVKDDAGQDITKFGGSLTYTIKLDSVRTEISGNTYSDSSGIEIPLIEGKIKLCRLNPTKIQTEKGEQIYPLLVCETS